METPVARFSSLIVSASAIGFLLAGCSAAAGNAVVGIPASAPPSYTQAGNTIDSGISGIDKAVQAELAAANAVQSDGASPGVLVEINALTSVSSLVRAEAFTGLQKTGANEIAKRQASVNALIVDVRNAAFLSGITLSGSSLSATLLSMLYGVNAQLDAFAATIASDSLPDVLRSDVTSIGPSTRVAGLIKPMTHLAIAGGGELRELNDLAARYQQLRAVVAGVASSNPNHGQEVARLADLSASIATATTTVDSAVGAVMSLTASGFPSNKTTVTQVRDALVQLRSPLGKLGEAKADVIAILALLAN
jgi:hypothetical protein